MHEPVLLKEVVEALAIAEEGRYVDGTLGLGGHAEAVLKKAGPKAKLLGLDADSTYLEQAKDRLQPFEDQTITRQVNFRGLQGILQELGWDEVDGIVLDLGLSSAQLADEKRGFSFQGEAPLDMRLNPHSSDTVLSKLQKITDDKLAQLLFDFGETRHARKLSRNILSMVSAGQMKTTMDLARICERVIGRHGKIHPATRTFLALRCLANDELAALKEVLETGPLHLKPGGRMAVISFHSLEDRLVKYRFRQLSQEGADQKEFALINKKPITPSDEEVQKNPRARSAKLRVLERIR